MSSAYSITASVNPPRAVYLDYPLGHTAGRPDDRAGQLAIMRDTLRAFADIRQPGTIVTLPYEWDPDHGWKDRVMRPRAAGGQSSAQPADDRVARLPTPQYQTPADAEAADPNCPTCIFLEAP